MEEAKRVMFEISTLFTAMYILGMVGWANLFMLQGMLTPPIDLTPAQWQFVTLQATLVKISAVGVVLAYIIVVLYTLILPYVEGMTSRYHISIEDTDAGHDDTRAPPTQP